MSLWNETSIAHRTRQTPLAGPLIAGAAHRRNLKRVMDLNGRELGATLFIIGSGPQLGTLTPEQISELSTRPTIGVNRTQYAIAIRYFLSAYPAEVILAHSRGGTRTTRIHLRPRLEAPLLRNTLTIRRVRHSPGEPLRPTFSMPTPTLHTFKNIALAATHFALVLGAARVVFIGVEQTSALHFYDTQPVLRAQMAEDIRRIRARSILTADHPYAGLDHLLQKLERSPQELAQGEFFTDSHEESFREFIGELRRHGRGVYATTEDSVVARAGATFTELEEALSWT